MLARVRVGDRRLGRAPRRLADEHRARLGAGLDARRGVDEVAGHHALVAGAERDGGLAGEHSCAGPELRIEVGDGHNELQCRPDRALGVVLLRDRRTPERHHGVADELLDRAAVTLDGRACEIEVAGQELARVLCVPIF